MFWGTLLFAPIRGVLPAPIKRFGVGERLPKPRGNVTVGGKKRPMGFWGWLGLGMWLCLPQGIVGSSAPHYTPIPIYAAYNCRARDVEVMGTVTRLSAPTNTLHRWTLRIEDGQKHFLIAYLSTTFETWDDHPLKSRSVRLRGHLYDPLQHAYVEMVVDSWTYQD